MNDEYIRIPREVHHSCVLPPDPDAFVWRYHDLSKFAWLLENRALYLRRLDLLEDKFEGTYSRVQIAEQDEWLRKIEAESVVETERESRIRDRQSAFVSCWCVSDIDLDLMWKGYVRSTVGVAVKSSIKRLERACDEADEMWPIDISLVKYIDHARGEFIISGMPEVFFRKDIHFRLDQELRVLCWRGTRPPPEFMKIPVQLDDLVVSVAMSPTASEEEIAGVSAMMRKHGLEKVPLEYSRQRRPLEE